MIILTVRPDLLRIEVGGRRATLPGWSMPSLDDIEFSVDRADISHWEDGTPMSNAVREEIVANLPSLAAVQGVRVVAVYSVRPPWNAAGRRPEDPARPAFKP